MSDWKTESATRKAAIVATLERMKLTVESVFVPFSRSRNKAEKSPNLNWIVTIKRDGSEVLKTEYSAGIAHCPSYDRKVPATWDRPTRMWQPLACAFECESGFANAQFVTWRNGFHSDKKAPILPDHVDVIYSLIMDSSCLNCGGFENWASDFGYDSDSRKAESIYKSCLEIALKLRAAIGESGMSELETAFQDY